MTFDVNFSADGGATWTRLGSGSASRLPVKLPTTLTANARIAVSASGGGASDMSDASFRVASPFTVTYPNGGETLTVGQQTQITWSQLPSPSSGSGIGPNSNGVTLDVSYDGGTTWTPLAGRVTTPGRFDWTVSGPVATRARIRVREDSNAGVAAADPSDADFTIAP